MPQGLEGVCAPATWTDKDHRSVVDVPIVQGTMRGGKPGWKQLDVVKLGRDAAWLGR